ncbi:Hsp33 family molecular chaperone HslO [Pelotomaculum terephthalicicum JT]|uniref:Hsp33 family molecular chaperone HslO n=1 Tax=Pelotomaculum TaxID=191373 RepID=UPI0009C4EBFB|nr:MULTISPECIES: Hsp33 family molecular chaperone HslO [Pelotomaculum]MCG9968111.1 Hsp33 family molecular chaperone HslO [Pelotomaculum terephthalicicum JT]OPX87867.1 MAG: 33 kDa chaperonin [Pelotomaculum sp. PtaB.Bin117]OPY64038.1 MAG: 33 kDa chaperonin [Pelotomaculum sp. PtaU1.Bin065]
MKDYLVRGIGEDEQFRVFAAVTTCLVEEARHRHDTWPVASAALGRGLTAGLLLGANLKGDDILTLRILGDGPLGAILVTANAAGEVRGYVQEPHIDLPAARAGKLPVGAAVGKGFLHVTKDLGLREPFTGSVELVSGEIGEDVAQYLLTSEQTPSAVSLGVLVGPDASVRASGGLIIQLFPGASEKILSHLEKCLLEMPPVSSLVNLGMTPEEIVAKAVKGLHVQYLEKNPVRFACKCSREKVGDILAAMGKEEIEKLLREQGKVEVHCHFCGENYIYEALDLNKII